jgi:phytanoyl-CoA hydroxylase
MTNTSTMSAPVHVAPDQPSPPAGTPLPAEIVDSYRRNGFVQLRGVLSAAEVERFAAAAREAYERGSALNPTDQTFKQVVNVWREDPVLRELTFHARLAAAATELAGLPLRLWHDQLPHARSRHSLSAWVALVDVPVARGCMTFLPGQQDRHDIRAVDLTDRTDLFEAAPELVYAPRVTLPLRAGDVTFHNGYTPHTANANDTDEVRLAHVVIYVDRDVPGLGVPPAAPLTTGVSRSFPGLRTRAQPDACGD